VLAGGRKLRAFRQRISTLAALDLGELGDDGEAFAGRCSKNPCVSQFGVLSVGVFAYVPMSVLAGSSGLVCVPGVSPDSNEHTRTRQNSAYYGYFIEPDQPRSARVTLTWIGYCGMLVLA
jgi:hypothetical protein